MSDDSARRKGQPIFRGNFRYFPDAHLAIAELSRYGNDKHNPGEPLHWSKGKSNDHVDCVGRHLLEPFGIDYSYGPDKPVLHSVAAAWRALANAQTEIEELRAKGEWPLKVQEKPMTATEAAYNHARGPLTDGWQEWKGGECPVALDTKVQIRARSGATGSNLANCFDWSHIGAPSDIIAWRFAK